MLISSIRALRRFSYSYMVAFSSLCYAYPMQNLSSHKDPGVFVRHQLKNGITVYYKQTEQPFGLPKVACSVLVNVGGRDDPSGKEGAAHFFEHMPFRGTQSFQSLKDLSFDIEQNGGYINAFTTDEATGYEVIVSSEMLESGVARIADMFIAPLMRDEDIEIERDVIIEELRNKQANVNFYARQELMKGLLGDHPLVHAVIGTEDALNSITKADLIKFHREYYAANNVLLFFAGSFDPEQLVQLCERYFGEIAPGKSTTRNLTLPNFRMIDPVRTFKPDRYNRSVYVLGRALPSGDLVTVLKWRLFISMLARGMNSPLHSEIREKRGLAYSLNLSHAQYQDVNLLTFSVSTRFSNMDEVDRIFWDEAEKILSDEVRFNEAKHMNTQALLHREFNVGSLVDGAIDVYLDFQRVIPLAEYIDALQSVTLIDMVKTVNPALNKAEFLNIRVDCDRGDAA